MIPFVNLHMHSDYSIGDGASNIDDIVTAVKKLRMNAAALTDHGSMGGILNFYKVCIKQNVKPILGCEVYINDHREILVGNKGKKKKDKTVLEDDMQADDRFKRHNNHLVLLAKNIAGYKNLLKIVYDANKNGFYYRPLSTTQFICEHAEGLIALTACHGGQIPQAIMANDSDGVRKFSQIYKEAFKDDFYFELQYNELEDQHKLNNGLIQWSKVLNIPLISTVDCHYAEDGGAELQDIIFLVKAGLLEGDPKARSYECRELYVKNGDMVFQSAKKFKYNIDDSILIPSIEITQKIADETFVEFELGQFSFPQFDTEGKDSKIYFKELVLKGFKERIDKKFIPQDKIDIYKEQLKHEVNVICEKDFETYFLVIQDFVNWAKKNSIMCGAGRGSASGSLVSYVLRITEVDPIEHGLIFERFLNVGRSGKKLRLRFFNLRNDDNVVKYSLDDIKRMCIKFLKEKDLVSQEYKNRLKYELEELENQNMSDYWSNLIANKIKVENGNGLLLTYCLGISDQDPIKENIKHSFLIFGDAPDIDLDFESERKKEIEEYLIKKYGSDKVAHVIAYGKLHNRGAIRDVGRVKRYDLKDVDFLAKEFSSGMSGGEDNEDLISLEDTLADYQKIPDKFLGIKNFYSRYGRERVDEFFSIVKKLLGLNRNYSLHAAGVVISPKPLYEFIPVQMVKSVLATGFQESGSYKELSDSGLLKVDILGLTTCSIIKTTIELVKKYGTEKDGKDLFDEIWKIDLNDERILEEGRRGRNQGAFQFSGIGMSSLLRKISPSSFSDIVAANALYRPATLESGEARRFYENKHGRSKIEYEHPILEKILGSTYGVMTYQEQIIRIFHDLGGFDLIRSDEARKILLKAKDQDKVDKLFNEFREKVKDKMSEENINKLLEKMVKFAKYSFNKAHAVSYSVLYCQTQYLKIEYPLEFGCALLRFSPNVNDNRTKENKLQIFYSEISQNFRNVNGTSIKIFQPLINYSSDNFDIVIKDADDGIGERQRYIIWGISNLKGIGDKAAYAIIEERKKNGLFKDFKDFVTRVPGRVCNKRVVDALIFCGAFDSFKIKGQSKGNFRNQIYKEYHEVIRKERSFDEKNELEDIVEGKKRSKGATYNSINFEYKESKDEDKLSIDAIEVENLVFNFPAYHSALEIKFRSLVDEYNAKKKRYGLNSSCIYFVNELFGKPYGFYYVIGQISNFRKLPPRHREEDEEGDFHVDEKYRYLVELRLNNTFKYGIFFRFSVYDKTKLKANVKIRELCGFNNSDFIILRARYGFSGWYQARELTVYEDEAEKECIGEDHGAVFLKPEEFFKKFP